MDTTHSQKYLTKPQPTFTPSLNSSPSKPPSYIDMEKDYNPSTENLTPPSPGEFDPIAKAKPCSPFYLYNHDSRASLDQPPYKHDPSSIHVKVHDLEAGGSSTNLTPCTTTQEKRNNSDTGRLRMWSSDKQCMTKPKLSRLQWLRGLPRWQRMLVRLLIAVVIVGAMVGIGVGISIRVHGGVYENQNQQSSIPS